MLSKMENICKFNIVFLFNQRELNIMVKPVKIGLFGFGRIGRNLFRLGYSNPNYQFKAISDLGDPESLRYLLMRDSIHGSMEGEAHLDGNYLSIGNQRVRLLNGGRPGTIPWDALDVDIVIDSTGKFNNPADLKLHLESGAKRVIVAATPEEEVDRIVVGGITDDRIKREDRIISATSSTTQVLALMLTILDENFGVKRAMMTTVHAYTSDQPLADAVRSDLRRSRSAVENIIPNKTKAPEIVGRILPQFKGKVAGVAFNVPVPDGSCVDLTTELENVPDVETLNAAVKKASMGAFKGIVGYTDDPIVSSDVIGVKDSMLFDAQATMVTNDKLVKTICWYDNGWGFSQRILELVDLYANLDASSESEAS